MTITTAPVIMFDDGMLPGAETAIWTRDQRATDASVVLVAVGRDCPQPWAQFFDLATLREEN